MTRITLLLILLVVQTLTLFAAPEDTLEPYGTIPAEEYTTRSYYDGFQGSYIFEYNQKFYVIFLIFKKFFYKKSKVFLTFKCKVFLTFQ